LEALMNVLSEVRIYVQKIDLEFINLNLVLYIIFVAMLFSAFILIIVQKNKIKKNNENNQVIQRLLNSIDVQSDLTKQLYSILDIIISIVATDGYFIYLWDNKSGSYVLRTTKYRTSELGIVEVSYSGLTPYEKEKYNPPLGLSEQLDSLEPEFIKDGEVPLLRMGISGGKGQIRMGPITKISPKQQQMLKVFSENADNILDIYLTMDKLNNDVEIITTTGNAITELSKSAFKMETLSSKIMAISSQVIEAGGCCFAIKDRGKWNVPIHTGLSSNVDQHFITDNEALENMYEVLGDKSFLFIKQNSKEFYSIPYYLVASGIQAIMLVQTQGIQGMAVFLYYRLPRVEDYSISVVLMMTKRLGELWENQTKLKSLSNSYVHMLQILVDSTDNLEPTTVGHSELIANYSTAIAMELKLPQSEVESIRMAAYFHDVGMLGLSNDILLKQGKYTQLEYEMMKLHSIVGASIIEATTSKEEVVSYIRHHHERWDGYGYPDNLKQNQIPLGARIIAVADMFNAKLQGRKYREPVPYERAVSDLLAASGTQLDPRLVKTLLSWLNKKRSKAQRGKAMGPCWEINCCPIHISKECPAYGKIDKNCWEINGVNCLAHGSKCSSCFVKTEMLSRSDK